MAAHQQILSAYGTAGGGGGSSITVGNVSSWSVGVGDGGPSFTFSTHSSNGNLLVVDVAMSYADFTIPTGITWDGVALTQSGSVTLPGQTRTLSRWMLVSPAAGVKNLVITFAGEGDIGYFASIRSFGGVNTSNPTDGLPVTNTATAAAGITTNISSSSDKLVIDAVHVSNRLVIDAVDVSNSSAYAVLTASQTEQTNGQGGYGTSILNSQSGSSYKNGAPSVSMAWTLSENRNLSQIVSVLQ